MLAWYAEPPQVAVNLFHLRGGRVVDRRDFYWEDLDEFDPGEFLPSLLKQLYLDAAYLPRAIHVPRDFEDRELLEEILSERAATLDLPYRRVEIAVPQRGPKHAFLDLVEKNARHSFEQRFRVLKPSSKAIAEALESALNLPEPPKRIESFDISHIQGSDTVASMVVWENGKMKKSDYRKFIIRGEWGNDDFASMREAVERRYRRVQAEKASPCPSLMLIDGGLGQLHAAAQALEKLEIINQPVAGIAKQEEILFVLGQEDEPIRLRATFAAAAPDPADPRRDAPLRRHLSPPAPRAAHASSELDEIPGVGERTAQKLLRQFGSVAQVRRASVEDLSRRRGPPAGRAHRRAPARQAPEHVRGRIRLRMRPCTAHFLASKNWCATFEHVEDRTMGDNTGSKVSYFLVGLGIGALVGILFAPKSGEETREFLTQEGRRRQGVRAAQGARTARTRRGPCRARQASRHAAEGFASRPRWMRAGTRISGRSPRPSKRGEPNGKLDAVFCDRGRVALVLQTAMLAAMFFAVRRLAQRVEATSPRRFARA